MQKTTGSTTTAYNLAGALYQETYPSGRAVQTLYDTAGRATQVSTATTNYATNITYFPSGPIHTVSLGNKSTETWTLGAKQPQPIQLTVTGLAAGASATWIWGYGADATNNGNVMSAGIANGAVNASQSFSYDLVNRLASSSEAGAWTRTYGYDNWGNGWVTSNSGFAVSPDPTMPTVSTNFDANNRLQIDGASYDAAGNQKTIAGYTNTYDAENRLVTSTIGGVTTTYTYDGDGKRVGKSTGGSATVYVYDAAGELAAEYSTAPAAAPCTTCYLTADTLGSTRMITDGSGNVKSLHDYLPFGEEITSGVAARTSPLYPAGSLSINDGTTQKFTGKERDAETGNDYFGARYLSAAQMRWTIPDWSAREDPVPYSDLRSPQTLNLYAYLHNNPVGGADPDGHEGPPVVQVPLTIHRTTRGCWRRAESYALRC